MSRQSREIRLRNRKQKALHNAVVAGAARIVPQTPTPQRGTVSLRIELGEAGVTIIFPSRSDNFNSHYEEMEEFGVILQEAIEEIPVKPMVVDWTSVDREQAQINLNTYMDKYVYLFFDWTDRIYFSYRAAKIVVAAIRIKTQDLKLLNQNRVRIGYNQFGQPRPYWEWANNWFKKTFGPVK